jgi:8-oxo-dGTP diphosphatase
MAKKRIQVVSAAIVRDGKYLITQRMEKAVLPLLWEFPGGKVEAGEDDRAALKRELKYRLGVEGTVGELISTTERDYEKYVVELHLYRADIGTQQPRAAGVKDVRWVASDEFEDYDFTPADQRSMDALLFADRR